jgi:signal transduction histidine kinase
VNLQKKLTLHYVAVIVAVMLFSYVASSITLLLLFGFDISFYGAKLVWSGLFDDSFLLVTFFLAFSVFFFGASFMYGRVMSEPLFFYLDWVERLSQGKYNVLEIPRSRSNKSPIGFRLFHELTEKMRQLSERLSASEIERMELEDLRRDWTSGVTHDLKTPLSYIQGYTTMLLSDEHQWTIEEQKKFITIMQEKANHMQRLIEDLSDAFQFENGVVRPILTQSNIVTFAAKVMEDVRQQPAARNKQFRFVAEEDSIFYEFDEKLIERALVNLLMNAVLHNPPETLITVTVQRNINLCITISDKGVGMSEKEKNNLFQRYYRGTSTEAPIGGTGLGMVIAEQFIAAHQGAISVQSAPGEGTVIAIHLPL